MSAVSGSIATTSASPPRRPVRSSVTGPPVAAAIVSPLRLALDWSMFHVCLRRVAGFERPSGDGPAVCVVLICKGAQL